MKRLIFICFTLWLPQLHRIRAENNIADVSKIVEYINSKTDLPWKADTYGASKVDVKLFSRNKMGLMLPSSIMVAKSNPRSLIKHATLKPDTDRTGLPVQFTWANQTHIKCPINHIRDQSNCGSCWAVSTAAAFGDRICIQSNGKYKATLSQEHIAACDSSNMGCSGGYMENVNTFLVKYGTITGGDYESDDGCQQYTIRPCGFPSASKMPCEYSSSPNPKCRAKKCNNDWYPHKYEPDSNVFKAKSWFFARTNSTFSREDRIRDEIYRHGPVTAGFMVLQDFMFYKKGIYVPSSRSRAAGGHAVRIVGWGVEKGLKYWHVANSWSTAWGEGGFFRIIRGVNAVGFERMVSVITTDL